MMTQWICEFILGAYCAWLALTAWERLCLWWKEGKDDLEVELMDHDDPRLQNVRIGRE